MPAEHLRALIKREAPGRSVRELEEAAGVPKGRLGYYLKPGTKLDGLPKMHRIHELGQIIGCATDEVFRALLADIDGEASLDADLPDDERELLAAYRRLGEPDRHRLRQIADVLHGE